MVHTRALGPRILLVNDDGIDSRGLKLLEEIVRNFSDDVWVVAPDEERSGAGHSISISHPIRVRKIDDRHFAVKGSPTDCALLGINEFLGGRRPDVLLSGINNGPNLAEDLTYSGTASAAMEGALLGIPSIALSQVRSYGAEAHWETSAHYLPDIIRTLMTLDWPDGNFININVPNVEPQAVTGTRLTKQGQRPPGSYIPVKRVDERHVPYYWIKIQHLAGGDHSGTDLEAIRDNAISVTPVQLDMTNYKFRETLRAHFSTHAMV